MTLPYWLAFKLAPWISRHIVAEDPSDREPAWTRVHPTHDDEDARFAFYANLPMGCARIEHWRAVIAGVAVDYWTAAAVVRRHRYGGESYVSGSDAVADVKGLIERVGEAARAERATAQGTCD